MNKYFYLTGKEWKRVKQNTCLYFNVLQSFQFDLEFEFRRALEKNGLLLHKLYLHFTIWTKTHIAKWFVQTIVIYRKAYNDMKSDEYSKIQ